VPGVFATIAEATAAATLGDVVLLAEGTFREYVDFAGKAITIRGESQTGTTLMRPPIDSGQFPGSTVRFENGEGPDSILENLTLQGDEWHMFDGGAIKIVNASPTIRGCVLSSNRAQFGGAVYAVDSGAQFVGNRFLSNRAVIDGGAVCAVGTTAFPDFYDNEFTGNFANAGGAIRLQAGGTWLDDNAKLARLSGNAFTRNEAVGARAAIGLVGGAIHVGIGVRAILEDNTFIGNEPTDVFHEDAEL